MNERLKGAIGAGILAVLAMVGQKAVAEYRYYQQVKLEHQRMVAFLDANLAEGGKTFTRKDFINALLVEAIKQQKGK